LDCAAGGGVAPDGARVGIGLRCGAAGAVGWAAVAAEPVPPPDAAEPLPFDALEGVGELVAAVNSPPSMTAAQPAAGSQSMLV